MRRLSVTFTAAALLAGAASATTSEAIGLRAGPGLEGEAIGPVWMAKCPAAQRLVGLRLIGLEHISGVQPICARLRQDGEGIVWASVPSIPEPPPPPPPPRIEIREVEDEALGTVLRASSEGVTRLRGSRAIVVTVHDEQTFPMPQPVVTFTDGGVVRDLVCPSKQFVRGLRVGSEGEGVSALQVLCGDEGGRFLSQIGPWSTAKPVRKGKKGQAQKASPLQVQRIECRDVASNPHDGKVASAVFGTVEGARVQTIGMSCARDADPGDGALDFYATAREALDGAPRLFGWSMTYDRPLWRDGRQLAACFPGSLDTACVAMSADRYCIEVRGYDRALNYQVGRFARDSVSVTGERCPRGACRAFGSITCGFGTNPVAAAARSAKDETIVVRSGVSLAP